jgi:DNA-binding Lrp family transcriptional regulator
MGLITMSERDLQWIKVLSKAVEGRMTIVSAAHVLALSPQQVRRLLERLQTDGAAAILLRHRNTAEKVQFHHVSLTFLSSSAS